MTQKIILLAGVVFLVLFIAFNPLALNPNSVIQTSSAVQIPEALSLAVAVALTALLALGANYLFEAVHLDLRQFSTPIAIALSGFIVTEAQHLINLVPEQYDATLLIVFRILVVLLGSVGLLRFRKPAQPINGAGQTSLLS